MVRLSRPVVLVLALLVSPLGVAVCEVVCGTPVFAAGHHAPPTPAASVDVHAQHAHHDHHQHDAPAPDAPVAPVSDADGVVTVPGPECDPLSGIPARVRHAFSGLELHAVAVAHIVLAPDTAVTVDRRLLVPHPGPPDPPRHAPVPLRI